MKALITFFAGVLFALGLGISGMTQPHIVRGFHDVTGQWDYRLLGVMVGAIVVHAIAYRIILRRKSPIFETSFYLPTKKDLDRRLVGGAIIFGLGWGWAGICPGPGIVALLSGDVRFFLFIFALITGMLTFHHIERKFFRQGSL